MNLRAMATLEETFRRPVGLSDHTLGIAMPIAAAALSACVIEKHITLDCSMVGPDHRASLNPIQFKEMVAAVRAVECALGDGRKEPRPVERDTARIARKSLHARCDLTKGAVLGPDSIVIARPATGLPPYALPQVIGRSLRRPLAKGEPINLDDLV
jgi:N-acetylneuraminate synthase/N,N'-diacetyllegionaminate synthase